MTEAFKKRNKISRHCVFDVLFWLQSAEQIEENTEGLGKYKEVIVLV